MMKRSATHILKDESGQITLDFIFALGLAFGFSILFFAVSFTLSMVEVGQYITYSVARTYYAANVSKDQQEAIAQQKFDELKTKNAFKVILGTGWVTLGKPVLDNFNSDYATGVGDDDADQIFVGARIPFNSKVLDLQLPFMGRTSGGGGKVGQATLNAYLMREVSTDECQRVIGERVNALKQLDSRYQSFGNTGFVISDNGC